MSRRTFFLEIVVTSLILALSQGRHQHGKVICEGGRLEADKWFDGCQWCICEPEGPVCSPRDCSAYVAHVPPCENLGSRWRDGCYHCTCGISGIECAADRDCLVRRRVGDKGHGGGFLSGGKCMQPMDYRCICGVDGVPSCSAEVIDRSAYKSTPILMNVTRPRDLSYLRRTPRGYNLIKSRTKRRVGGDNWYRSSSPIVRRNTLKDGYGDTARSRNKYDDHYLRRDYRANTLDDSRHEYWRGSYDNRLGKKRDLSGYRDYQSYRSRSFPSPDAPRVHTPSSLLVATDNRCRFGPRWYGGSLRCYCDVSGSITCGDPSFVSTRIDGFTVENKPCENGHVWEEASTCRSCECIMSTLVVCKRSPSCPLPFLIKPSPENVPNDGDDDSDNNDYDDGHDRRRYVEGGGDEYVDMEVRDDVDGLTDVIVDGSGGSSRPDDIDEELPFVDDRDDDIVIDLNPGATAKPDLVIRPDQDLDLDFEEGDGGLVDRIDRDYEKRNKAGTVVTVQECQPHRRWREGCMLCRCTRRYKKRCSRRRCPGFRGRERRPGGRRPGGRPGGKPVRRPGRMPGGRRPGGRWPGGRRPGPHGPRPNRIPRPERPSRPSPADIANIVASGGRAEPIRTGGLSVSSSCGRFTVGQRYWKECNLCTCTTAGPRCTAKSCNG